MSKYKSKFYAKALLEALAENKLPLKKLVMNFLNLIEKNQDSKKIKEIIAILDNSFLNKTGNKKIVFETARKINLKSFGNYIKKGDKVEEKINPDLIAGVKIIIDAKMQLDNSLQNKLNNIF